VEIVKRDKGGRQYRSNQLALVMGFYEDSGADAFRWVRVTVNQGRFAKYRPARFAIQVGQNVGFFFFLHVAARSASAAYARLEVAAGAPVIEAHRKTDISQVVDARQKYGLPEEMVAASTRSVLRTPGWCGRALRDC